MCVESGWVPQTSLLITHNLYWCSASTIISQGGRASLLKPCRVLDLVSLSQDCHKEPCCNPVACHQQNAAQSKPCARVMASILLLSTGCEVAMSAAVISGLENLHADEIILSSVRKVCVQGVCRDLQCSVLYSTSTYHLQ